MEVKTILKSMLKQYPVIYTMTMVCTLVYCSIFAPDEKLSLGFLASMMIFAFIGDLPMLLFCSSKELTEKQWNIRKVIHFVFLECLLLGMAKYMDLYHTLLQGVFFFILVMMVYVIVSIMLYCSDKRLADSLNEKIKNRKKSKN